MAMIRMNFEREGGRLVFYSILFIQFFTLGYHQITTRIDLFPFNGARHYSVRERRIEAFVNGIIMCIAIVLSITQTPLWIGISGVIWTIIMVGAVLNWWIPYLTGREIYPMSSTETWEQMYERIFANTMQVLPVIRNHPRPNLEHVILHVLISSAAISLWVYLFTL